MMGFVLVLLGTLCFLVRIKALEGERDRQYEENVSLITQIAALERRIESITDWDA